MKIGYELLQDKWEMSIDSHKFSVDYPKEVWSAYPDRLKRISAENLVYLESLCLPYFVKDCNRIDFDFPSPLFREKIFDCVYRQLPVCADVDKLKTEDVIKRLLDTRYNFSPAPEAQKTNTAASATNRASKGKSIVPFSFGKESLLTYCLAGELGMAPEPVLSLNKCSPLEMKHVSERADRFSKEFKKEVWKVGNGLSLVGDYDYWGIPETELGNTVGITEYFFNSLPFAEYLGADYVLIGSENSCNISYLNPDGYTAYPAYDQTSVWLMQMTKIWQEMSGPNVHVSSLVEPVHELGILRVLHNRYPKIGRHQLSCFPDFSPHGQNRAWCQDCSKCARIFILMKGNGIDPARVGFCEDMLKKEYKKFYFCFGIGEGFSKTGYDMAGCGRDEELYAFYLAYKNGAKGYLIDEFKRLFLKEAVSREDELHDTYFGVHDSMTIPKKLLKPLSSIYKEEFSK